MARRYPVGIRLITRRGNDWTTRYPLVAEAVNHLKVRSCLIDGEVVRCDEKGVTSFQLLRHRRNEPQAFLYAFDLLELDGADLRREPIEVRKATLASILRNSRPGVRLNEHLEHPEGAVVFQHACKMGLEGIVSKRLGLRYRSGRSPDWVHDTDRAHPRHWPMQLAGRADRRNRDPLLLPPTRRPRTGLRRKTIARNSPRAVQGMPELLASSSAGSRGKGIATNEEFACNRR